VAAPTLTPVPSHLTEHVACARSDDGQGLVLRDASSGRFLGFVAWEVLMQVFPAPAIPAPV
jgi:hypothetical protein